MADSESGSQQFPHFGTQAIHAGQEPEQWKSKAVVPPISVSTTFKQNEPGKPVSLALISIVQPWYNSWSRMSKNRQ